MKPRTFVLFIVVSLLLMVAGTLFIVGKRTPSGAHEAAEPQDALQQPEQPLEEQGPAAGGLEPRVMDQPAAPAAY